MPPGDPAGYLPNVLKSRRRKGQPAYQPRGPQKGFVRSGGMGDSAPPPKVPGTPPPRDIPVHSGPMRSAPFQSPALKHAPHERKQPGSDRNFSAKLARYTPDRGKRKRRNGVYRPLKRGTINSPESSSSRKSIA